MCLIALCSVLNLTGRAHAVEWQTLLEEDFGSPEVSFYTGQASEAFYGVDDMGRYSIDGLSTGIDSLSALTKNLYYYYVEAEVELTDTRIGDMAYSGLVFHYNKKIPGKLAYYVFYIYDDGYYGAKRVIGESSEVILPLTRCEYVDSGRPNILAVDARGTRFDLYVNGRYVDGFTDVRIDGGGFGFYVSQQTRAAFDNFKVKIERRGGGPSETELPQLLEDGSPDRLVPEGQGQNSGDYAFPEIPRDPTRAVYPWEVGVDKSESASEARAREREQLDLANTRLGNDMTTMEVVDSPPVVIQPRQTIVQEDSSDPLPTGNQASLESNATEEANASITEDIAEMSAELPVAQDDSYINVSLEDVQTEAPTKPAERERTAAEIRDEMRRSMHGDEWSDADPYIPPEETGPAASDDNAGEGQDAVEDSGLKGIELPALDFGGEDAVSQADPAGGEVETVLASNDGLSLFPEEMSDQDAGTETVDPAALLETPRLDDNAGSREIPGSLQAVGNSGSTNDVAMDVDPFDGNPDVTIVYDDFTDERWPVATSETSSYRYFGAAYEIDNTLSDTMAISYQQDEFSDARYGVDVEYLDGLDYVGYGLATRFTVENGQVSYYGLFISQSGEYLLLKVDKGNEIVLRDWGSAPGLSSTLSNRIGIELIGNSLHCLINGEVVATVTDDSLQQGGYALLCGPGTSARFDNLSIKGLTGDAS